MSSSRAKLLTKPLMEDHVDDLISKLTNDTWSSLVSVEGVPKCIAADALKKILLEANRLALEMIDEAVGVSYLKKSEIVELNDVETALVIRAKGVTATLASLETSW